MSTTLNTNEALHVVERVINGNGTDLIRQASPLAFALMGEGDEFVTPIPKRQGRTVPLLGGHLEMQFILDKATFNIVEDNDDALSPVTPEVYTPAKAVRVKGTMYSRIHTTSDLEEMATEGRDIQKSEDFIDRQVRAVMASAMDELATALYSSNGQSRSTLSGLAHWISATSVIGLDTFSLDRSLDEGIKLRSYVDSAAEALSELKVLTAMANTGQYGGKNDVILGNATAYAKLCNVFVGKDQVILNNDKWHNYGSEWRRYGRSVIAPDAYCTATSLYFVNMKSMHFGLNKDGLTMGKFQDNLTLRAAKSAKIQITAVLACDDPRSCGLINSFT